METQGHYMSPKRAGGLDCWAVRELKCASESTLQHICDLFQTIESTKRWPSAAEFGRIALIDKGEGPAIDAQRPLTILNLIYRLYAAFRLMDVSTWVRDWVHPSAGAAPGASVQDVWSMMALELEESFLNGTPLHGLSLDWHKCFDSMPRVVALELWRALGAPGDFVDTIEAFYEHEQRCFSMGKVISPLFHSTTGFF